MAAGTDRVLWEFEPRMKAAGKSMDIRPVPAPVMAELRKLGRPLWDEYAAKLEAKGFPGKQYLQDTIDLVAKYRMAGSP